MKKIEIFNNELNRSNFSNDSEMKAFKVQVDLLLKNVFEKLDSKQKAVIIGAGKMSDFTLNLFVRFFNEIVITDVDLETVNGELRYMRLPAKQRSKIDLMRVEYTGFEVNKFFEDFKERIVNCHSFEKIEKVIKSKLEGMNRYRFLKAHEGAVDFMYISPIYTQLVYNQLMRECAILRESGYPEHLIKFIEGFMLDEMPNVIDRFNNNIVKAMKKGGEIFVLSDIFQLDKKSGFFRRVKNGIKNHSVMEEIYDGYKAKYGMGLGDFGLFNLDEKMDSYLSRWLIWPYNEESSFVVKLKIYKKK